MRNPRVDRHFSEVDLADDEAVEALLELVIPPLQSEAALMFMPASGSRSETGTVCLVDDLPARVPADMAHSAMATAALTAVTVAGGQPSLLVAFQRGGEHDPRDSDVVWVDAARAACREQDVRLLGVWLQVGRRRPRRMDAALAP